MSTAQKIIKYLAIAFAFFIIFNIISAILFGVLTLGGILGLKKHIDNKEEIITEDVRNMEIVNENKNEDIAILDVELVYSKLIIKYGDVLKAETNNKKITCEQDNNKLVIRDGGHNWFSMGNSSELTVYVPNGTYFENAKIEAGAGEINIESLNTKKLTLSIGAGSVTINNLIVENNAKVDGGAGKLSILNSKINNLDLDMGVGKCEFAGTLIGDNKLSSGVGKLDVRLIDGIQNYSFKVSKGIGSVSIDNKEMSDNSKYGDGDTSIKLDGGIGSIDIK